LELIDQQKQALAQAAAAAHTQRLLEKSIRAEEKARARRALEIQTLEQDRERERILLERRLLAQTSLMQQEVAGKRERERARLAVYPSPASPPTFGAPTLGYQQAPPPQQAQYSPFGNASTLPPAPLRQFGAIGSHRKPPSPIYVDHVFSSIENLLLDDPYEENPPRSGGIGSNSFSGVRW
jgi:hypothetical protein